MIHKDCPKPGCGYSVDGVTEAQARHYLILHLQRADHVATLRKYVKAAQS